MQNIRKILFFFIFMNLQCFILKSRPNKKNERRLDVLDNPLGGLLEHTNGFVKELKGVDQKFEGIKESIVDKKKDIFKSMDTILSTFLEEHRSNGEEGHEEE